MSEARGTPGHPALSRPHPWHGIPIGDRAPRTVTAFIEIVPTDTVKYEMDKGTGYLRVDRPQRFSNVCPTLYGFVPQTWSGPGLAAKRARDLERPGLEGDGDPLDICVLTEKSIAHGDLILHAIPIGGLHVLDRKETDDKVLAVLEGDAVYGGWTDIADCPAALIERLRHYFLTYKDIPGEARRLVEVTHVYGAEEAHEIIRRAHADHRDHLDALLGRT
jgi:inorganic pyrophosphatase